MLRDSPRNLVFWHQRSQKFRWISISGVQTTETVESSLKQENAQNSPPKSRELDLIHTSLLKQLASYIVPYVIYAKSPWNMETFLHNSSKLECFCRWSPVAAVSTSQPILHTLHGPHLVWVISDRPDILYNGRETSNFFSRLQARFWVHSTLLCVLHWEHRRSAGVAPTCMPTTLSSTTRSAVVCHAVKTTSIRNARTVVLQLNAEKSETIGVGSRSNLAKIVNVDCPVQVGSSKIQPLVLWWNADFWVNLVLAYHQSFFRSSDILGWCIWRS